MQDQSRTPSKRRLALILGLAGVLIVTVLATAAALLSTSSTGGIPVPPSGGPASTGSWISPRPATAPEPPPAVDPPRLSREETAYLDVLRTGGIGFSSDEAAIAAGVAVCDFLLSGGSLLSAAEIVLEHTDYSARESGYIVGAAESALCPGGAR